MSPRGKALQARLEVVTLRPGLLKDRDAAAYLGISVSAIRAKRLADQKALREGRPITGPKWITLGPRIFYKLGDLDGWIAQNAVECGVVSFSDRGAPATSPAPQATP